MGSVCQVRASGAGRLGSLLTCTGRAVPPPPVIRLSSERKAKNDLNALRSWLLTQGIAEAEARNDDFNLLWMRREDPRRLPQASVDLLNVYLFGSERGVDVELR